MSRLKTIFDKLKKENKKAFSVFLMSGYPDKDTFIGLLHTCADAGVSFIEVGMPFSDPSADGPVIKTAGTHALLNGTTIKQTIEAVQEFRRANKTTPIVWMGYFNAMYNYGIEKFMNDITKAGVDALLPVDLPAEEADRINRYKSDDVDIIQLVTPVTTEERLPLILGNAGGFVYFVSINGITGTKDAEQEKIKQKVLELKTKTDLPVLVGFGIKNPEKAQEIDTFADGAIVGSAVITKIAEHMDKNGKISDKDKMYKEVKNFVSGFVNIK